MKTATTPTITTHTIPEHNWKGTMTYEQYYAIPAVSEYKAFDKVHDRNRVAPTCSCVVLDLTKAEIKLTPAYAVDYKIAYNGDGTKTITTETAQMWAVYAPYTNGNTYVAVGLGVGYNQGFFATEAEAVKHLAKISKVAAKWHAAEAQRAEYAEHARRVCGWDANTVTMAVDIDPNTAIGKPVRIHQMGKFRAGIIVGQTPTKYTVVYTTPSNPDTIRTTKIDKKSDK